MAGRDVFINCPFSADYETHFRAIVFTVMRAGFEARCAREADDAGENRYTKICRIITECPYGIHDISKTELDHHNLPRFNMPFELGLFLGARQFGGQRKTTLILDIEPYRYQKFLSDIAGQDIRTYDGGTSSIIEQTTAWLRAAHHDAQVPGGLSVVTDFGRFNHDLPDLCTAVRMDMKEIEFQDFKRFVASWIAGEITE